MVLQYAASPNGSHYLASREKMLQTCGQWEHGFKLPSHRFIPRVNSQPHLPCDSVKLNTYFSDFYIIWHLWMKIAESDVFPSVLSTAVWSQRPAAGPQLHQGAEQPGFSEQSDGRWVAARVPRVFAYDRVSVCCWALTPRPCVYTLPLQTSASAVTRCAPATLRPIASSPSSPCPARPRWADPPNCCRTSFGVW